MGVGELLDRVRQLYLDHLVKAVEGAAREDAVSIIMEPALVDRDGQPCAEGMLSLPLRKDVAVLKNGAVQRLLSVDTDRMLSFEPIVFYWAESMQVSLGPFQWQQMPMRLPLSIRKDWEPLKNWFACWFAGDADRADDDLQGVVHFLSDPEETATAIAFEVDLGSAPVEAFEELLDAVAAMDVRKCEIGQTP